MINANFKRTFFLFFLISIFLFQSFEFASASKLSIQSQMLDLSERAYKSEKIGTSKNGWVLYNSISKSNGMQVKIFREKVSSTKYNYAVAFRGTYKEGMDFITDLVDVTNGANRLQTPDAIAEVKKLIVSDKKQINKLYFTGHSLGGYLAAWVQSEVVDKDLSVPVQSIAYTFNAPGISAAPPAFPPYINLGHIERLNKIRKDKSGAYNSTIINYVIKGDPIASTGDTLGTIKKSNAKKTYKNKLDYHYLVRFKEIF